MTVVVATCSEKKRTEPTLLMRHHDTFKSWWYTRLHEDNEYTPRSLYVGAAWKQTVELEEVCRPIIFSAGMGLLTLDTPIPAYSCTFNGKHIDSIPTNKREWWDQLKRASKRSLIALAKRSDGPVLLACSETYLAAIRHDITEASLHAEIIIISAGCRARWKLDEFFLPGDSRLLETMGGPCVQLNVRTARWLLENGFKTRREMKEALTDILERAQPSVVGVRRTAVTDEELIQWIQERDGTHTHLLTKLQEAGYGCRRDRFKKLHEKARKNQ